MRLGVLSQWYDPEPGGGAVPGVLARGLAGRGHDVRVLTGFPNYPRGQIYPGYRRGGGTSNGRGQACQCVAFHSSRATTRTRPRVPRTT